MDDVDEWMNFGWVFILVHSKQIHNTLKADRSPIDKCLSFCNTKICYISPVAAVWIERESETWGEKRGDWGVSLPLCRQGGAGPDHPTPAPLVLAKALWMYNLPTSKSLTPFSQLYPPFPIYLCLPRPHAHHPSHPIPSFFLFVIFSNPALIRPLQYRIFAFFSSIFVVLFKLAICILSLSPHLLSTNCTSFFGFHACSLIFTL